MLTEASALRISKTPDKNVILSEAKYLRVVSGPGFRFAKIETRHFSREKASGLTTAKNAAEGPDATQAGFINRPRAMGDPAALELSADGYWSYQNMNPKCRNHKGFRPTELICLF